VLRLSNMRASFPPLFSLRTRIVAAVSPLPYIARACAQTGVEAACAKRERQHGIISAWACAPVEIVGGRHVEEERHEQSARGQQTARGGTGRKKEEGTEVTAASAALRHIIM